MSDVPIWFTILAVLFLIYYIFRSVIWNFIDSVLSVFTGKMSCLGCLFSIVFGLLLAGLLIWYIIDDIF